MICLIFQINILGKGNLAPTSAIDQVQNYVLGGIIGGIIYNQDITVLQFVMVLLIWTLIVFIVKYAKEHNATIQNIIDGRPRLLIKDGQLLVDNCMRAGMTANELMFRLRSHGIYEIAKVKSGILEQNGQLVVIENSDENIRFPLINDGQINMDVLELIHHDEKWIAETGERSRHLRVLMIFISVNTFTGSYTWLVILKIINLPTIKMDWKTSIFRSIFYCCL